MTIKQLKEKIQNLPDNANVEFETDIKFNNQVSTLTRNIDSVDYFDKNNLVKLKSWWPIQFFY